LRLLFQHATRRIHANLTCEPTTCMSCVAQCMKTRRRAQYVVTPLPAPGSPHGPTRDARREARQSTLRPCRKNRLHALSADGIPGLNHKTGPAPSRDSRALLQGQAPCGVHLFAAQSRFSPNPQKRHLNRSRGPRQGSNFFVPQTLPNPCPTVRCVDRAAPLEKPSRNAAPYSPPVQPLHHYRGLPHVPGPYFSAWLESNRGRDIWASCGWI
jgi:hypothetical protein